MPTAFFSLVPPPRSIVTCVVITLLIGYLVHVFHKLTKTVLFSEFIRWNELKRYHVIATVLAIGALIADIIGKLGCNAIQDREEQYPIECTILIVVFESSLLLASASVVVESMVFSYCRLYMILPGIFMRILTNSKEWTSDSRSGSGINA
jgi:hypothetical protein